MQILLIQKRFNGVRIRLLVADMIVQLIENFLVKYYLTICLSVAQNLGTKLVMFKVILMIDVVNAKSSSELP